MRRISNDTKASPELWDPCHITHIDLPCIPPQVEIADHFLYRKQNDAFLASGTIMAYKRCRQNVSTGWGCCLQGKFMLVGGYHALPPGGWAQILHIRAVPNLLVDEDFLSGKKIDNPPTPCCSFQISWLSLCIMTKQKIATVTWEIQSNDFASYLSQ